MKYLTILFSILFLFGSCSKKDNINETFAGYIPIVSIQTPKSVSAGQDIVSKVHCELSSMSGSVYFKGFEIKENASLHYEIRAKALFKDWNKYISMPVMSYLDTTVTVKTTKRGKCILNFYNDKILQQSDTVQVN